MLIHNAVITGSLTLNGTDIGDITGSEAAINALNIFSSSIYAYTASNDTTNTTQNNRLSSLEITSGSLLTASGSFSTRVTTLETASGSFSTRVTNTETTASNLTVASSSFSTRVTNNEATGSNLVAASASFSTRTTNLETASGSFSTRVTTNETNISNLQTASGSFSTRVTSAESSIVSLQDATGSYATTGSNNFVNTQRISATNNAIGFTSTASLYTDGGLRVAKDAYVSGTLYLNNLTVYGTQSVQYITASQLNISTNIISVNTDTPSIRYGGLSVYDSGSTGLTGSLLWDSEANHWIYTNPSGSTYSGGMLISGPRASALGNEQGTTACALMMGQGGDHITSSGIFHYGNATCFYGNATIQSTGAACFASNVCINDKVVILDPTDGSATALFIGTKDGAMTVGQQVRLDFSQITTPLARIAGEYTGGTFSSALAFSTNATCTETLTEQLRIDCNGIACFRNTVCSPAFVGGTISGTTGTFSSTITSNLTSGIFLDNTAGGTNATQIRIKNTGGDARVGVESSTGGTIQIGTSAYAAVFGNQANYPVQLTTNGTTRLTIASTGEATFACQVCSGVGFYASSLQSGITIDSTTNGDTIIASRGLSSALHGIVRTVGQNGVTCAMLISTRDSVDGNLPASVNALWGLTNNAMVIATNNVERMRVANTGIACFACQVCAPQLRLSGTTNMILQPSFVGSSNLRNGGAIQYTKNFTIFTDDGVNGCGFDLQYWNGSAYYPGLRLNNVSSGFASLLLMQDGGNVGIGASSPQSVLHLCSVNNTTIRIESACDQAGVRLIAGVPGTARASRIDFLNGATCVGRPQWTIINDYNQNGTNDLSFVNCDPVTRVMTITQNGCIGIGTNTPNAQLHITAPYVQGTSAISAMWLGVGGFTATLTCASGVQPYATYTFGNGNIVVSTNNPTIRFQTITTTTADMLQIIGASFNANAPYNCNKIAALNSSHLSFETAGSSRMVIDNAGNIGLNCTTPGVTLDVGGFIRTNTGVTITKSIIAGEATPLHLTYACSDGSGPAVRFGSGANGFWDIQPSNNNQRLFFEWSDSTNLLTFKCNGYVGINCIDPAYSLHVNGQIYSTSTVSAANSRILNQQSSNTYANNSANTVTGAIAEVSGIIRVINNLDGTNTDIPFYAMGGSGVAYRWTVLDPDTGWLINQAGWNFDFTTNGSQSRTFNLQAINGSGNVIIQQASGTANYTMKIFIYSQA